MSYIKGSLQTETFPHHVPLQGCAFSVTRNDHVVHATLSLGFKPATFRNWPNDQHANHNSTATQYT